MDNAVLFDASTSLAASQVKSQSLNHQVGHILNAASRSNACQKQAIQNLTHKAD